MTPILSSFAPLVVVFFVIFGFACYLLGYGALKLFVRDYHNDPTHLPIPAFVGAMTTAWALSLGFVASDVWTSHARAETAAENERSAIVRIIGMAQPEALDQPQLANAMWEYLDVVQRIEWDGMNNVDPATEVEAALQHIRLALIDSYGQVSGALLSKMVADFDSLQDARNIRLAIGGAAANTYKWMLLLVLTVLSMLAMAFVHADRWHAGVNALRMFGISATLCLTIVGLYASPYTGAARLGSHEISLYSAEIAWAQFSGQQTPPQTE